jgi:hypothetical protein
MTKANHCPIPYAGGKNRAAPLVWQALAGVNSYIEPCCGTAAVLLARPKRLRFETINDADGFVVNFHRSVQAAPDEVGRYLELPRSELELSAAGRWLLSLDLTSKLRENIGYYDPAAAGVWAWYMSGSIGVKVTDNLKQIPRLIDQGVIGRPFLAEKRARLAKLQILLQGVRILCNDWSACLGESNHQAGWHTDPVGVFLDPPYAGYEHYREGRDGGVSAAVREWCLAHGQDPAWHIVLAGYLGEHEMPGWRSVTWKTGGKVANKHVECLWLSPHCAEVK